MQPAPLAPPGPGLALARGVCRHLRGLGFATLTEFVPAPGMRVDVAGLGPKGEIWIVECKSCRADYAADRKWPGYLGYCDRFFWAVDAAFPAATLPAGSGLILADPYDAAIIALPSAAALAAGRRRALVQRFARTAAERLAQLTDPGPERRFLP
ncbi:MmcB family DNA repair protein [soil metagenome]